MDLLNEEDQEKSMSERPVYKDSIPDSERDETGWQLLEIKFQVLS